MKIVFVNENPSICMIYDHRNGLHSVWKIRRTTDEVKFVLLKSSV